MSLLREHGLLALFLRGRGLLAKLQGKIALLSLLLQRGLLPHLLCHTLNGCYVTVLLRLQRRLRCRS